MKRKTKRILAYIYMPVIFIIIGITVLYIALAPVFEVVGALSAMLVSDEIPTFSKDLESIFVEPEVENVEEQEQTVNRDDITWPKVGRMYGKISCERIGLDANLYMGDTNKILKAGVGQWFGSKIPGYGELILLAAHCTTYFAPLEFIQEEDIVTITTSYGVYEYEVYEVKVVDPPFDEKVIYNPDEELLTMYTCYPFELLSGSRKKRLFVNAKKIAGPDIVFDENSADTETTSDE